MAVVGIMKSRHSSTGAGDKMVAGFPTDGRNDLYMSGNCLVMADLHVLSGNDLFVLKSLKSRKRARPS